MMEKGISAGYEDYDASEDPMAIAPDVKKAGKERGYVYYKAFPPEWVGRPVRTYKEHTCNCGSVRGKVIGLTTEKCTECGLEHELNGDVGYKIDNTNYTTVMI